LIKNGVYPITTTINGKSGLNITGENSTILDYSKAPNGIDALSISGSAGPSTKLSQNATKGEKNIYLSNSSEYVAGDLILVSSSAVWKNNENSQRQGELKYIKSVSSGVITLTEPLEDTYFKVYAAGVQKITPVKNVTIQSIRFVNSVKYKNLNGVSFDYGVNVRVTGCYFDLIENIAIGLYSCIDSRVDHNSVWRTWKDGEGYGTSIAWACQNVVVENNDYHQCRHATMIGGGGTRPGICRHITFQNNYAENAVLLRSGSLVASHLYDTHNSGEDINFIGNEATGVGSGFDCELYSGTFRDNYIHDLTLYGIILHNPSKKAGPIIIQNNRIIKCTEYGIIVETRNVEVMGNTITNSIYGIAVESVNCKVHDNIITTSARYGIYLTETSSGCQVYENTLTLSGVANIYDEGTNNIIN
jgi:parallel beta-helix repeat protein